MGPLARLNRAFLAVGALLILATSVSGGVGAEVVFAGVAVAYPFVLMAIGAERDGRLGRAAIAIVALLVIVELALVFMLAYRGRVVDGPWLGGLPLALAWQLYGVFLLPLAVSALGFALTFRRFGVGDRDLERLRASAARRGED